MKILVLGAGKMGSAVAFDLMKSNTKEIGVADINFELAKKVADRYNANPILMNVRDDEKLIKTMKKYDAVVSAVTYNLNYRLAKAAVKAKTNFCDLGGNTKIVEKELKLDEKAKKAGIALIPDCGLSPGTTNILAALGYEKIKKAYAIHTRVGGLPQKPKPPLNYGLFFSVEGLINEYTGKCTILKKGKIRYAEALTGIENIYFPRFGKLECFHTSGGSSTLPRMFRKRILELDDKTIRYPGHAEKIKAMVDLGLASEHGMIKIGKIKIKPREFFVFLLKKYLKPCKDVVLLRVTVLGKEQSIKYEMIDYFDEKNKMSAMMRTTAYPASITAQMMVKNDTKKGAFPPELSVPGERFLYELSKRDIKINTELNRFG